MTRKSQKKRVVRPSDNRPYREFVDEVARCFEIDDPEKLGATISKALHVFVANGAGMPDFRERDTLDELEEPLIRAVELLRDPLNGNRLTQHWRAALGDTSILDAERKGAVPFEGKIDPGRIISDLIPLLDLVRLGASGAHRERTQKKRGPLAKADLRSAAAVLVDYWKSLGREFTSDPAAWRRGRYGVEEPTAKGEHFVFAALSYFVPDRAGEFKAIAREFRH